MIMRKARLRIGILSGTLAASLLVYGLFFDKYEDSMLPEWVYFGLLIYVLFLLWYLLRKYRSKT